MFLYFEVDHILSKKFQRIFISSNSVFIGMSIIDCSV